MKQILSSLLLLTVVLLSINQCSALDLKTPQQVRSVDLNQIRIPERLPLKPVGGLPECIICSFVVDRVEHYLLNKTNETEIIADLDKDCGDFKDAHDVEVCQDIVNKYLSTIIKLLLNHEKPEAICAELHMCGLMNKPNINNHHQSQHRRISAVHKEEIKSKSKLILDQIRKKMN
ncbi:hypothetical protein PPL_02461 [Heterostelium album PN500]|uniref:Saposin B-type domain-containing protein n=1 Tax=Heterostelium pallidum (strain ATCC 26659 / Pp 5 / PN500) TaxID=670386 RepID=D3B254_HETP5|nr:hypothetical protein PPL_02461 [Heterostelium album PN500]EFA84429.1 hypothetical protein PPL_02461 [Heterostelium album PN500]|eukprot:XP_020436543.1 hypothetical protein PPL_02461 [Heterostelium album PN500]